MLNMTITQRGEKTIVTFNQNIVGQKFFDVAKELEYKVVATGNPFLTHEIECSKDEFETLVQMAKE